MTVTGSVRSVTSDPTLCVWRQGLLGPSPALRLGWVASLLPMHRHPPATQVLTWDLPEVGLDRAEGVVLGSGLRVLHERIEERRLADVWQPYQPRLQAAGRGAAGSSAAREEAGTASEHWERCVSVGNTVYVW